jgi:hypothetical protein
VCWNSTLYLLSFFIAYSSNARLKSFEALARELHEAWISLRILKKFAEEIGFVRFQQSSNSPVANIGNYSLWYEFDFASHTMRNSFCSVAAGVLM